MDTKFIIEHDDLIPCIVQEISNKLECFGLRIIPVDYGDGYEEYEIVKIDEL